MKLSTVWAYGAAICVSWSPIAGAITLDLDSTASIKSAASTVAYDLMKYYTGNETGGTPGTLPAPYYWWEAGAMFMTLINYWYYTGDASYNDEVIQGILWQAGPKDDLKPDNQTLTEGNDDQGFWGMAVMTAAEANFPNPPAGEPGWVALAQAVFNQMATRWDNTTCEGGLRWQIYPWNAGYNYKNSIANGCFFNIAARLALYTGNETYANWANKIWDWETAIGLIGPTYSVYDGSSDVTNCSDIDKIQFTYNQGVFLFGAAVINSSSVWETRVSGLLNATDIFFKDEIMYEPSCEDVNGTGDCDVDQESFKGYLATWMAGTAKMCPWTYDTITTYLNASAIGAAAQCDGGTTGTACGEHWTANSTYDGTSGVGQQMSALSVIQSTLINFAPTLLTNSTGGSSVGNPAAGTGSDENPGYIVPATNADRAGAGFLTALLVIIAMGGIGFMVTDV